jgi:chromosome partitioning protein
MADEVSRETPAKVVGVRRLKEAMAKPASTRIFTVANQKGGVGKTTTTVNIAAAMAMGGLRVLVIDLDPQGNASTALGVEHRDSAGVYEVLMGDTSMSEVVKKVAGFPALDCVSSNTSLANAEINLVSMVARELQLKAAIDEVSANYDYIFIDCPPSLGLLTINAFAASKELLIPIQTEYYALEGLSQLLETYSVVKKRLNPNLNLSTIVLTMFDSRTRLSNDVAANVRSHFPNELIDIPIPRAVRVSEAPSYHQTVMTYDPLSPGAIAYMQVAREIAERGKPVIENDFDSKFNSNVVSIHYKGGIA